MGDSDGDDVSCWICLEEGSDSDGQPLCRDCSCRGDAGYAHLSCLIEYAKRKCVDCGTIRPWEVCPSCHQKYQRDLALGLSDAALSFIGQEGPHNNDDDFFIYNGKLLEALRLKVRSMLTLDCKNDGALRAEGRHAANKMLSIVKAIKSRDSVASEVGKRAVSRSPSYQSRAYRFLGDLCTMDGTVLGYQLSIQYFEKLRVLCEENGDKVLAKVAEEDIVRAKALLCGGERVLESGDKAIKQRKEMYAHQVKLTCESSLQSLTAGANVATTLLRSNHTVEAERLLTKLAQISRRVHGAEHHITRQVDMLLKNSKNSRCVALTSLCVHTLYQAVRYECGGEKCIVRGPVEKPRQPEKETMFTCLSNDLSYGFGTPVMCHGLKKASHLNGKIGDIRNGNEKTGRYEVHLEDEMLKPVEVKPGNLRIVFDLPDEK